MTDIATLQAEVQRLRDLLTENDIDPDPEAELYGPPTAPHPACDITRAAVRLWSNSNEFMGALNAQYSHYADCFAAPGAKIGKTLRIRLPADFKV